MQEQPSIHLFALCFLARSYVCRFACSVHILQADSSSMAAPAPFTINIPQSTLDDLKQRLQNTRLPDHIPGTGWDMGTEPSYLQVRCLPSVRMLQHFSCGLHADVIQGPVVQSSSVCYVITYHTGSVLPHQ